MAAQIEVAGFSHLVAYSIRNKEIIPISLLTKYYCIPVYIAIIKAAYICYLCVELKNEKYFDKPF